MELNTKIAVTRVLYEEITDFESLADFNKESVKALSKNCSQTIQKIDADRDARVEAEPEVKGTNISTIDGVRLLTASKAVKYYKLVGRTPDSINMNYAKVLSKLQKNSRSRMHRRYQSLRTRTKIRR